MKALIEKQLEESMRDALLGLYLSLIDSDVSNSGDINTQLKTANDLYHHLLLDVLVSQDVPTSPVACAIASLQQYINSIL
ncbi:neuraminidase-like domain-containing protein, partial [Pseudomonas sp. PS01303]|uniref:neuraminidase-like domain-containing protein n=1 Tax=Pseudomonas sp. PS01303 TaxID=2991439 RepID=UPI00249AE40A